MPSPPSTAPNGPEERRSSALCHPERSIVSSSALCHPERSIVSPSTPCHPERSIVSPSTPCHPERSTVRSTIRSRGTLRFASNQHRPEREFSKRLLYWQCATNDPA